MSNEAKQITLKIQIDEQVANGIYANMVVVQHSSSEFIFDFIFISPGQPSAKVRARIIMAPEHCKRFYKILGENLTHYEERFGEIRLPDLSSEFKPQIQ